MVKLCFRWKEFDRILWWDSSWVWCWEQSLWSWKVLFSCRRSSYQDEGFCNQKRRN